MHVSYAFWFVALAALFGVAGLPLPVGIPPLPEDPALVRMAPRDSLAFVSWCGTAPLPAQDALGTNHTVQLAAEPDVRAAIAQLRAAVLGMARGPGRGPAEAAGRRVQLAEVVLDALAAPGCVFVQRFPVQTPTDLAGGLAVKLGGRLPAAEGLMAELELVMLPDVPGDRHPDVEADGVTFHALPIDTGRPFVGWAAEGGWFLLAVGREIPAQMVAGLRGKDEGLAAHPGYRRTMPACAVERPVTRAFLDLTALRELVGAMGGLQALAPLVALGLGRAEAVASCSGLEGDGFCSRLRLATPGRDGLLGVFDGPPLAQDGLCHVPADAEIALSARVDPLRLEQALLDLAMTMRPPDLRDGYQREFVARFPEFAGVRLREDLLQNLGTQVTLWNAPSQGGFWLTGLAGVWSLRDGRAFGEAMRTMMERMEQEAPTKARERAQGRRLSRNQVYLESFGHAERRVHWLDSLDDDFPFGVAWAATDGNLVFGLQPQPVKDVLDGGEPPNPDRSLARLPIVNRRGKATVLVSIDAGQLLRTAYGPLTVLFQAASGEWQREGFDFDLADLPRLSALLPHTGREQLTLEPVEGGWALQRTGTLPMGDPLLVTLVVGLGLFGVRM